MATHPSPFFDDSDDPNDSDRIKWIEVFPSIVLFSALAMSLRRSCIMLAALALALTPLGWRASAYVFLREADTQGAKFAAFVAESATSRPPPLRPAPTDQSLGFDGLTLDGYTEHGWKLVKEPITLGVGRPLTRLLQPLWLVFGGESLTIRQWLYVMGGMSWNFLIWTFCGSLIARRSVLKMGVDRDSSWFENIAFVLRRWRSLVAIPKVPLAFFALTGFTGVIAGFLLRSNWGAPLAGLIWPALLIAGQLLGFLAVFAVPLFLFMIAAIMTETDCDEYQAFQRAFSYTLYVLPYLLLHILGAAAIGTVGALLIDVSIDVMFRFAGWLVDINVGAERWNELRQTSADGQPVVYGMRIIGFFEWLAMLMMDGFRYAFLFSAGAALYLRFRLRVDETEFDDVHEPNQLPDVAPDPLRQALDELTSGK
jgi:hypothetical protein